MVVHGQILGYISNSEKTCILLVPLCYLKVLLMPMFSRVQATENEVLISLLESKRSHLVCVTDTVYIKSLLWIRHGEMSFCFCPVKLADVIHTT